MPELHSPKCPLCITKGIIAQTYKVAGKGFFRCRICKQNIPADMFDREDYLWKSQPNVWEANMEHRGIDLTKLKENHVS